MRGSRELRRHLRHLDGLGQAEVNRLKALFSDPDKEALNSFISSSGLLPDHLLQSVEVDRRMRAVIELEEMLSKDLTEGPWQKWFEKNDWVLGTEFVRTIDERPIDVDHIADYLMQAYDGFLDLIEIKRPEGALKFWADALDHGNYIPHSDLVKAITQANRYILEVEREANSVKFLERVEGVKAIKPRCVLIFGRSQGWNDGQREAYRILNASYHNLTILTFDHVMARARRILDLTDGGSDAAEGR
ncbi:MAG TPA: Shedu anti-phage system protein SduA domain-containing protein [Solirubrobacterales bacterium]|nr:Shedu anti-phage system protein SduA domain-containing protein [Solirubrobacterales bacterium]